MKKFLMATISVIVAGCGDDAVPPIDVKIVSMQLSPGMSVVAMGKKRRLIAELI